MFCLLIFTLFNSQSQSAGNESTLTVDEHPAVAESPPPSPCKLIEKCNAAVTKAGNDIERAADEDSDSDTDSDKKKPAFQ